MDNPVHTFPKAARKSGVAPNTLKKADDQHPGFSYRTPGGHRRITETGRVALLRACGLQVKECKVQEDAFFRTLAGSGRTAEIPDSILEKKYSSALLLVAMTGEEREGFLANYRNARKMPGNASVDVCAAFGLHSTACWALAVDRAEALLAVPSHLKSLELKKIADRLAAFRGGELDAELLA